MIKMVGWMLAMRIAKKKIYMINPYLLIEISYIQGW
jgi:hypothetical protein